MSDEPMTEDPMIAALLRERAGLAQRGLDDRVAQVDEQLKLRGYQAPAGEDTDAPKRTAGHKAEAPKGRQQRAPEQT